MFHILTVQSLGSNRTRWLEYECPICGQTKVTEMSAKLSGVLEGIIFRNKNKYGSPTRVLLYCEECEWPPNLVTNVGLTIRLKVKRPPQKIDKIIEDVRRRASALIKEKEKFLIDIQQKKLQINSLKEDAKKVSEELRKLDRQLKHLRI